MEHAEQTSEDDHDEDDHDRLGRVAVRFAEHGVDFVIIGGWSIDRAFPEIGYRTDDLDLVVAATEENYERLAAALNDLQVRANHRGVPRKDPAVVEADKLKAREHWRFHAKGGIVDIMSSVGIISGYDVLAGSARPVRAVSDCEIEVPIADPKVVYVSKAIAGRAKDQAVLGALREAIEAAEGQAGIAGIEQMEAAARLAMDEGDPDAIEQLGEVIKAASTGAPAGPAGDRDGAADASASGDVPARSLPIDDLAAMAAQPGTAAAGRPGGLLSRLFAMFRPGTASDASSCGARTVSGRRCRNPRPDTAGGRCAGGHRRP